MRDAGSAVEKPGHKHRVSDVGATVLAERGGCGSVVLAFYEGEAVLEFNDPRYFFSARVIVREGNDGAVVAHQ